MAETPRISVALDRPDLETLRRAARLLLEGELVVAPSDTVYGILGLSRSDRARRALARAKGRPGPFLVLISSWEEARSWTEGVEESVWRRLRKVWPGPVTVILPTRAEMPGAQNGTLGLRMPRSVFLTRLLREVGEPLLSTSANPSGGDVPRSADDLDPRLVAVAALILDGGPTESVQPSTVVDWTGAAARLVRRGRGNAAPLLDRDPPRS